MKTILLIYVILLSFCLTNNIIKNEAVLNFLGIIGILALLGFVLMHLGFLPLKKIQSQPTQSTQSTQSKSNSNVKLNKPANKSGSNINLNKSDNCQANVFIYSLYTNGSGNKCLAVSKYNGNATELSISSSARINNKVYPVTEIGSLAFANCESLKSVTIPDSVTTISNVAFDNCGSLRSINIPDSIIRIGVNAFKNCPNISQIHFSQALVDRPDADEIFNQLFKAGLRTREVLLKIPTL